MTITKGRISRTFTEADLLALAVRFEIRGTLGKRQYFVDGVEVNEQTYTREFALASKNDQKPRVKRSRRT